MGLIFGHGWVRILAAVAVVIALALHAGVDLVMRVSPLYCFTMPIGAVLFSYMLLRSTVVYAEAGRHYLARYILSVGGAEARRGVILRDAHFAR